MNVRELIRELEKFPENLPVVYDNGRYLCEIVEVSIGQVARLKDYDKIYYYATVPDGKDPLSILECVTVA